MKKWILKIFICLAAVCLFFYSYLIVKIYKFASPDEARKADAAVVLGASQWNGEPSPVLKARLDYAANLYGEKFVDKIILTGGVGEDEDLAESEVGKKYLVSYGIDGGNIFLEKEGRTTKQSLDNIIEILNEQKINSVILVSDGFHMARLKKMCEDLGINAFLSSALESPIRQNKMTEFKYVLREAGVYILYLIFKI